ncbi:hypothetical protein Gotur_012836 [Gossypium turneri]
MNKVCSSYSTTFVMARGFTCHASSCIWLVLCFMVLSFRHFIFSSLIEIIDYEYVYSIISRSCFHYMELFDGEGNNTCFFVGRLQCFLELRQSIFCSGLNERGCHCNSPQRENRHV